jgi:polysaccharide pyruvyl transferase CsaB
MSAPLILVAGVSGQGNVGDDAIGIAVNGLLRDAAPDAQVVLLGGRPERLKQTTGLTGYHLGWRPPVDVARTLALVQRSAAVLIGGGGLLQDHLPHFYRAFCLLALAAKALRKPVMFYATGVYPPRTRIFAGTLRLVLNLADIVTVRDEFSARTIADAGVNREVIVTADPAITLRALPCSGPARHSGTPLIGVSLRPWYHNSGSQMGRGDSAGLAETLAKCLDRVVDATGGRLLFFPMHFGGGDDDQNWQSRVLASMRHSEAADRVAHPSPLETQAVIAGCDIVVGMRLHANVLGAAMGVPSIALAYDPKVREFMRGLGCEDRVVDLDALEPDDLAGRVARLLAERESASAEIQRRVETLTASARSCALTAARLAGCAQAVEGAGRVAVGVEN